MTTLFAFIVVLGILIFVHEFGHFIIAKLFDVKVLKFSLGFGPAMVGKKVGETEYVISALPLGGFVKMVGENPDEEVALGDEARAFSHKPVWQRFLIVLAGPVMNLALPVAIFASIFIFAGLPEGNYTTTIGKISPGGAGEKAGLISGDQVLRIDDTAIEEWQQVYEIVTNSEGRELIFTIKRGEQELILPVIAEEITLETEFGEPNGTGYRLGIQSDIIYTFQQVGVGQAIQASIQHNLMLVQKIAMGIWKLIQRDVPASKIGGPIKIAQMAGEFYESGWLEFFSFMAFISINLGLLNLLPIPVLDGGHLVFFSLEAVRRKPLTIENQQKAQLVGLFLLVALMTLAFYNDILGLFKN